MPDAGDDILSGLDRMVSTSGLIRSVQSPAEARTLVADATAKGNPPTQANPMLFAIAGMLASANGAKTSGSIVLEPAMSADWEKVLNTVGGVVELSAGAYKLLCETKTIGMKPYRRVVLAIGTLWGANASGKKTDLEVWINGAKGRARLGQWDDSTTAVAIGIIPANTAPAISMWALGAPGGSKVTLSAADEWSQLTVLAIPAPEL